jgi:hypothetical protein
MEDRVCAPVARVHVQRRLRLLQRHAVITHRQNTAREEAVGGVEWGGSTHIAPVQLRGDVSECACSRRVTKAAACASAVQAAAEVEQPRLVLGAQRFGKRLNLDGSGGT